MQDPLTTRIRLAVVARLRKVALATLGLSPAEQAFLVLGMAAIWWALAVVGTSGLLLTAAGLRRLFG